MNHIHLIGAVGQPIREIRDARVVFPVRAGNIEDVLTVVASIIPQDRPRLHGATIFVVGALRIKSGLPYVQARHYALVDAGEPPVPTDARHRRRAGVKEHSVEQHLRHLRDGRVIVVKPHRRGTLPAK